MYGFDLGPSQHCLLSTYYVMVHWLNKITGSLWLICRCTCTCYLATQAKFLCLVTTVQYQGESSESETLSKAEFAHSFGQGLRSSCKRRFADGAWGWEMRDAVLYTGLRCRKVTAGHGVSVYSDAIWYFAVTVLFHELVLNALKIFKNVGLSQRFLGWRLTNIFLLPFLDKGWWVSSPRIKQHLAMR